MFMEDLSRSDRAMPMISRKLLLMAVLITGYALPALAALDSERCYWRTPIDGSREAQVLNPDRGAHKSREGWWMSKVCFPMIAQ